jgi:hypothetical protein
LLDQIVYTQIKIKGSEVEHWPILPRDFSPQKVYQSLEKAIKDPEKYLEKCSRMFDKTVKHDLSGHSRGIWTVQ